MDLIIKTIEKPKKKSEHVPDFNYNLPTLTYIDKYKTEIRSLLYFTHTHWLPKCLGRVTLKYLLSIDIQIEGLLRSPSTLGWA